MDTDLRADVIVVGGGFTGLSTALSLAERGVAVVLLEAEEPGFGASGRNGGQVNPGLKPDPDVVERDHGSELGARMNAFAGAAPALVFALIERLGIDCDARRNGTLRAAIAPKHAQAVRTTAGQLARRGAPVEILEGLELERMTGTSRYRCAMLDRRGGDLNPLKFARGLARALRSAGGRVYCNSRAVAIERAGREWRVRTALACVTAPHVVLATNGYTDGLWPHLAQTVIPVFGAIAATEPLAPGICTQVMPSRAVLYESGAVTVYYRIDAEQRLLIGGRGPMREVAEPSSIPHLPRYALRLWPALADVRWTHAWGGRLAMTTDHYPHIHEPAEGMLACLGYNGRGVAMATAIGVHLAQHIVDPAAALDLPISPIKPIFLHRFWRLGVRMAILRGRFGDYVGL